MNKKTFLEELSQRCGIPKSQLELAYKMGLDLIVQSLKNGDDIKLSNFGTFKLLERQKRTYFVPLRNIYIKKQAFREPILKFSKNFKKYF